MWNLPSIYILRIISMDWLTLFAKFSLDWLTLFAKFCASLDNLLNVL